MDYNVKPMIHRFRQNNMNIVMDVNSGIVHVVDDVTYKVLEYYNGTNRQMVLANMGSEYEESELNEVMDDLDELIKKEVLFAPMDPNYKMAIEDRPIIKALCINIAHDCNLRCKYCFAGQGGYGQWRMLMSFDVARRAVDFLIAHSGPREHCELDFFGGEPLMNWHVVQQTVDYVHNQEKKHHKKIKMSLTTNGMLLDEEKTKYLTDNHISLILSLDGRKEMHDRMRPDVNNEGTYDQIVKNLQYCIAHRNGEEYYVRGTFTRHNLDFTTDVEDMLDHGFPAVSMEPVVGDDSAKYSIKESDLPRVKEEYDRLAQLFIQREEEGRPFFFFHFNMDLWKGPCLPKRLRGCGAGHEYLAVVPNGDIYPCHQFVGREGYVVGNVYEGLKNMKMMHDFRMNHVFSKPECVDCWAKFFCSGGCHANNEAYAGDIIGVFDPGIFSIGDTLCSPSKKFKFEGIPTFAPEHFARVRPVDTMKRKQFVKGVTQIAQEGAIQVFKENHVGMEEIIVGVVGVLQFEVLEYRLKN